MNTAGASVSAVARASAAAISATAGEGPYWLSRKSSQTGRAPSSPTAAASSARRAPITSSLAAKPAAASHSVSAAVAAGRPAKIVSTTEPGRPASATPQPNTPSSRCGETTRIGGSTSLLDRLDEEALALPDRLHDRLAAETHHFVIPNVEVATITAQERLISNNTGPVHIAAAVGTPVVDLYALTNPQHTPWGVPQI